MPGRPRVAAGGAGAGSVTGEVEASVGAALSEDGGDLDCAEMNHPQLLSLTYSKHRDLQQGLGLYTERCTSLLGWRYMDKTEVCC